MERLEHRRVSHDEEVGDLLRLVVDGRPRGRHEHVARAPLEHFAVDHRAPVAAEHDADRAARLARGRRAAAGLQTVHPAGEGGHRRSARKRVDEVEARHLPVPGGLDRVEGGVGLGPAVAEEGRVRSGALSARLAEPDPRERPLREVLARHRLE